jgi:hypothetical protein
MNALQNASSTADAIADIQRVVERKRAEADKMRYDLNESLKDLFELQSQVSSYFLSCTVLNLDIRTHE